MPEPRERQTADVRLPHVRIVSTAHRTGRIACRLGVRRGSTRTGLIEQARASRERLLAHVADAGATVFAAHFAGTSAGTVTRIAEGFDWRYA
jgi:hypothetical protein